MDKPAVPKFGSFRPLKRQDNAGKEADKTAQRDPSREARSDTGSVRNKLRVSDRDARKHVERQSARRSPLLQFDAGNVHDDAKDFFVDRRGDSKNVEFGSIHRGDIPHYRRTGRGFVIGSQSARINREDEIRGSVTFTDGHGSDEKRTSRVLSSRSVRLKDENLRYINASRGRRNDVDLADFIALPGSGRKLPDPDEPTNRDYRFGKDPPKSAGPIDDEDSSDVSDAGLQAPVLDENQERNAILSAKTKTDPQDVDAWLALSYHQRNFVQPGKLLLTTHERRILADLRITILEKALKKISTSAQNRDRVWMALQEEGSYIWEVSVVEKKWKVALQECPSSSELSIKHVNFVQHNPDSFEFENCKQAYLDCLALLQRHALDARNGSSTIATSLQLHVLIRFTTFLREADFTELAFAIWQVLLEFHFFMPSSLSDSSAEDRLARIEEFWESETPRIGESNARGWCQGQSSDRQISASKNAPSAHKSGSRAVTASKVDLWRRTYQCLPASADEEDTNDPYRFVMFSDLHDVLKLLTNKLPQTDLFNACMTFLDLPAVAAEEGDGVAVTKFNDSKIQRPIHDLYMEHVLEAVDVTQALPKTRNQQESAESLFERDAFASVPLSSPESNMDRSPSLPFAHRVIEMLAKIDNSPTLFAIYHIAFEVHISLQTASKTAKHHLFTRPSGFQVLNANAMAETHLKRTDKADKLWLSALQNRSKVPQGQEDAILVWHAAIHFHLHDRNESKALGYLATITSDPGTSQLFTECASMSAATLERVRQELITGFEKMYASGIFKRAILYVDCLALLCYIISTHDLAEALDVYDIYDTRLLEPQCRPAAELLAQYKADMINLHLDERRAFRLQGVENSLLSSLAASPENSRLLAAHHRVTAQDRIRQLLKQPQERQGSNALPIQTIFRIDCELDNAVKNLSGSNQHTVRAAFSNALLGVDSCVRNIPSVWFRWLLFEKAHTQSASDKKQREEATSNLKMVFMEGLKYIPWVKSWVTMGIVFLKDVVPEEELERICDLIVKRGLRVRVEYDDT
jgi:hypothetical protein